MPEETTSPAAPLEEWMRPALPQGREEGPVGDSLEQLYATFGHPRWGDERIPFEDRLNHFLGVQSRSPGGNPALSIERPETGWERARQQLQTHFPGADAEQVRPVFERMRGHVQQGRQLDEARDAMRQTLREEPWRPEQLSPLVQGIQALQGTREEPGYFQRRTMPVQSALIGVGETTDYYRARRRFESGNPEPDDYTTIARFERMREIESQRPWYSQLGGAVAHVPAMIGEAILGGPLVRAAGAATTGTLGALGRAGVPLAARTLAADVAAREAPSLLSGVGFRGALSGQAGVYAGGIPGFVGRAAVQTAAMPSMYLPEAGQRALEHQEDAFRQGRRYGGEWWSPENLAPAFAMGMAQTMVLGSLGHFGERWSGPGIVPFFQRLGARTGLGMAEQQAVDLMAGVVSDTVYDIQNKDTKYGLLGDFVRGANRGDLSHFGQHFLTQAATFAAFSVMHGAPDPTERLQRTMNEMFAQGLPRERAIAEINRVHDVVAEAAQHNFRQSVEATRATWDRADVSEPAREYGQFLMEHMRSFAAPLAARMEQPAARQPITGETSQREIPRPEDFRQAEAFEGIRQQQINRLRQQAGLPPIGGIETEFGQPHAPKPMAARPPGLNLPLGVRRVQVPLERQGSFRLHAEDERQIRVYQEVRQRQIDELVKMGALDPRVLLRGLPPGMRGPSLRRGAQSPGAQPATPAAQPTAPGVPRGTPAGPRQVTSEMKAESFWQNATGNGRRSLLGGNPNQKIEVPGGEPPNIARMKWSDLSDAQREIAMRNMGLTPTAPVAQQAPPVPQESARQRADRLTTELRPYADRVADTQNALKRAPEGTPAKEAAQKDFNKAKREFNKKSKELETARSEAFREEAAQKTSQEAPGQAPQPPVAQTPTPTPTAAPEAKPGIPGLKQPAITPEKSAKIKELYETTDISGRKIADQLGLKPATTAAHAKEQGWTQARMERQAAAIRANAPKRASGEQAGEAGLGPELPLEREPEVRFQNFMVESMQAHQKGRLDMQEFERKLNEFKGIDENWKRENLEAMHQYVEMTTEFSRAHQEMSDAASELPAGQPGQPSPIRREAVEVLRRSPEVLEAGASGARDAAEALLGEIAGTTQASRGGETGRAPNAPTAAVGGQAGGHELTGYENIPLERVQRDAKQGVIRAQQELIRRGTLSNQERSDAHELAAREGFTTDETDEALTAIQREVAEEAGRQGQSATQGVQEGSPGSGRPGAAGASGEGAAAIPAVSGARPGVHPQPTPQPSPGTQSAPTPGSTAGRGGFLDSLRRWLAPATRGPAAEAGAGSLRHGLAVERHKQDVAEAAVAEIQRQFHAIEFEPDPAIRQQKFLDVMEVMQGRGNPAALPKEVQDFIATSRQKMDEREQQALQRDLIHTQIPHYIAQLWAKPGSTPDQNVAMFMQLARRPLAGKEGFKKRRIIDSYLDGITQHGMEPVSWNPAKLVLLSLHQVDKAVMAHDVLTEYKDKGLLELFRLGERMPEGFIGLDDPKAGKQWGPLTTPMTEFFDVHQNAALEKLASNLGVKIQTKFKHGATSPAGQAFPLAGRVERAFGTGGDILAHELGHVIDKKYGLAKLWSQGPIGTELRQLATMRHDRIQADPAFQKYVQEGTEKIANLVAAYLHAPELLSQVAPQAKAALEKLIQANPELQPLMDAKPSMVLGSRTQEMRLAGPPLVGIWGGPEEAITLINRHLSPGLHGVNAAFDVWREAGNMLNSTQLGVLSAFHAGFVTMEGVVSNAALGLQLISRGSVTEGLGKIAGTPVAPVTRVLEGDKLFREWFSPGSQSADVGQMIRHLEEAGGRAKMDSFFGGDKISSFRAALDRIKIAGDKEGWKGMLYNALPALSEVFSYPTMQWLVPRMKLGVFAEMARSELAKIGTNATLEQRRAVLGNAWDSVENRLGQMTYDNLFWNRTFKDVLMASIRSVGWNLGTMREIGGGVKDLPSSLMGTLRGEGISSRTAYLLALPMVTGAIGAILNYAMTGEGPQEPKDYFFPRTGARRQDGSPARLSLPSYMRDLGSLFNRADEGPVRIGQNLWGMAKGKLHPMLTTVGEMLSNEDFYGTAIYDPRDSTQQKLLAEVQHILRAFQPLSLRRFSDRSWGDLAAGFFGITQSPAYITRSWEQQRAIEAGHRMAPTPLERLRRQRGR